MFQLDNPAYGKLQPSSGGSAAILGTKTITENGVYNATDDGVDGYSEVTVETSGVDINEYFGNPTGSEMGNAIYQYIKKVPSLNLSDTTSLGNAFNGWKNLEEVGALDTSNITMFYSMFYGCSKLKGPVTLDISKATNVVQMFTDCYEVEKITLANDENNKYISLNGTFKGCRKLIELNAINCQKVIVISSSVFMECYKLKDFGGLIDIGEAYSTSANENIGDYAISFQFSNDLTHNSLMNIINGLYDIATKGVKAQQLILGSTNLAKLTAEEIAIATNKGWTVS